MTALVALALLPLHFEPNRGQVDGPAQFVARGSGYEVSLDRGRAHIRAGLGALTMRFEGANSDPLGDALDQLPGVSNYVIGSDPTRWRQNVPQFGRVRYRGVYPGIDVVYHGWPDGVDYDFDLAPGADPSRIRVRFEGAGRVGLTAAGDLSIPMAAGTVRQRRPMAFQDGRAVACRYAIDHSGVVRLKLGAYDHRRTLLIDPILSLEYALPVPGASLVAVDPSGGVYVAGSGSLSPGSSGVVIAKLTPAGDSLLYSTTIAAPGAPPAVPYGIAVDAAGNAYVGGFATAGFPVTPGAFQTAQPQQGTAGFVLKLDRNGNLVWSTLLGGALSAFSGTILRGVAVDSSGNVYAAGSDAGGLLATPGALQLGTGGFLVKLNPTGSKLIYAATLGGLNPAAIAIDGAGLAYLTGEAFVMKVNVAASAMFYDLHVEGNGASIAVDSAGNAYVTGTTMSPVFPTTPGVLQPQTPAVCPVQNPKGPPVQCGHAFVLKVSPDGQLAYATYLGSSGVDSGAAIAANRAGEAYVAGTTNVIDFPLSSPLFAIGQSGFLAKLNATASALVYSTGLGPISSYAAGPSGLALDAAENAYVAGSNLVMKVAAVPAPKIANAGVVNAASLLPGPLAPGEIVTLFGAGLGPVKPDAAGGTVVSIGGIAAPVLYAQANQVNAVVPFEVAGTRAAVTVGYQGLTTAAIELPLAAGAPAIFAADGSGAGPGAILNQDGKLNTPRHPAVQGEVVSIYATGGGQTSPPESDGQIARGQSNLVNPVAVTIGGLNAEVLYAGGAPSLVAGTLQINVRVPSDAPTGPGVPVTLIVGATTGPPLVTLAIRSPVQ